MPIQFQPIWISTIAHMEQHSRITKSASWFSKLFGRFDCPPEFPQINLLGGALGSSKSPLVYCQFGDVDLGEGTLNFTSKRPKNSVGTISGHFPELQFQLWRHQIKGIETYRFPDPFMKWANVDWVRIRTTEDILGGDFLMCVGGGWPKSINQQTARLLSAVQTMLKVPGTLQEAGPT